MRKQGFFSSIELPMAVRHASGDLVPKCGACGLYKTCKSPKMPVYGDGRQRILIVGEAPGETEDEKGRPFIGKAGRYLREALRSLQVDPDRDCWITNAVICRPPDNATPSTNIIDYCRPNLLNTLKELKPDVCIVLGKVPMLALIGYIWKEDIGAVNRWVGHRIPDQQFNMWICPSWHPSYLLRTDHPVGHLLFQKHLRQAIAIDGAPWEEVPNFKADIDLVFEPNKAASILDKMRQAGGPISFDYETDRLKPHHPDARIVTCSVCWRGRKTIAFPFTGSAVEALRELLRSDCPKLGFNDKFEEAWTRRILRCGVKNWAFDGMQGAHVLDNRPSVSNLDFQAYTLLGQPRYNLRIKPFLKSAKGGGNEPNRIHLVDMAELLEYNALDSLLEYKVVELQLARMGMEMPT